MISLNRYKITKDGQIFDKENNYKPIKTFKSNKYMQCCIYDENGKHVVGVHNVVAQALCDDWFDGCVVHHKDNNQCNNAVDNLECLDLVSHVKLHQKPKYKDLIQQCPYCKNSFVWTAKAQSKYYRNKYKNGPYCSQQCAGKGNH
ncbi:MAG: HNH endonuclease [Paludibacteraceae bacterium]|nr:HNH endonuclease [Paludibacteraceae bacterium]